MNTQSSSTVERLMDEACLERFLLSLNVRPRSVAAYRHNLKAFFNYLVEQGIRQPVSEHVFAYRNFLVKEGKKPSTVHAYIASVRMFFRWTADEGLYDNIAEGIRVPGSGHIHRRDALTAHQARNVLGKIDCSVLKGLRNYAIVALMTIGGLRCIEVSRAKVGDFTRRGKNTVLYIYGKGRDGSGAEYIRLSPCIKQALRTYLDKRGKVEPEAPLFAGVGNRNRHAPLSTRMISKIVKDCLREAGYDSDRLCAHSLRHTAVTLALKGGEKLEAVKEFARHTSVNTTLIYSHAIDLERSTCSQTIEREIFKTLK